MHTKLAAIVTGMQHSGTTYLNDVINSHSNIMSGFECGILLGDLKNFKQVKPFSDMLKTGSFQFGLPDDYLEKIKNMNYPEVFDYIQRNKGSKNDLFQQTLMQTCEYFTDKTPDYIYQIETIHNKIKGLNIPILIVLKNYDEIYYSWIIKRELTTDHFNWLILKCIKSLKYILDNPNSNIYVFKYNDIITKEAEYNKYIMNIILKHNKTLSNEILSKSNYIRKIKDNTYKKYTYKSINIDTENHKHKQLYNDLLNLAKIKL